MATFIGTTIVGMNTRQQKLKTWKAGVGSTSIVPECFPAWLDKVIHAGDRERTLAHWMGAVRDEHSYDIEYRIRSAQGAYRWFKTRMKQVLINLVSNALKFTKSDRF